VIVHFLLPSLVAISSQILNFYFPSKIFSFSVSSTYTNGPIWAHLKLVHLTMCVSFSFFLFNNVRVLFNIVVYSQQKLKNSTMLESSVFFFTNKLIIFNKFGRFTIACSSLMSTSQKNFCFWNSRCTRRRPLLLFFFNFHRRE